MLYNKPSVVTAKGLLRILRKAASRHLGGYSHYTVLAALTGMVVNRKIHLSSSDKLNDQGENIPANAYILSLSYGTDENLAMWALYGYPNKEAVRIKFFHDSISEWIKEIGDKAITEIYSWSQRSGAYAPLKRRIKAIKFLDVAYHNPGTKIFHHMDKAYVVKDVEKAEELLKGFVKELPWKYEKETRLLVELDAPAKTKRGRDVRTIALDFEDPIEDIIKAKQGVSFGPWGGSSRCQGFHKICGEKLNFECSRFKDLVYYRCNDHRKITKKKGK